MLYLRNNTSALFRSVMLLLLFSLGVSGLSAQAKLKFTIADFGADPFDFSAKDKQYEKFDGNGDRYAIIKVSSNNPDDDLNEYNFNFGNMKHIVEEHDGVLWVYVQRNAKLVTITRKGYAPINKYDLHTTIESGKNYVMSITSEEKKVYTQMVLFRIKPANAKAVVMVRSYKEGSQEELFGNADATGAVARSLEYGTYTYKVLADNYHLTEGRFTLNNKAETLTEDVELRPNFSDMTFKVDADADIYINGEKKGTRQWSGTLRAGNYTVECRQPNHKPSSQYVQVGENDNRTVTLKAPDPILGTVAITSNPLGAEIRIDGKAYGQTPQSIDLLIGKHTIEVSKTGYQPERQTFEVEEDRTVDVNLALGKVTTATIESHPSASKLYIDGTFRGHTPCTYEGEVGEHKVKLLSDGYKTVEKNVYFGNTDRMTFSLKKQYVKATDFYIALGAGFGSMSNASAALGTHLKNFNLELYYTYCFDRSPEVYWYCVPTDVFNNGRAVNYKPSVIMGGKVGYSVLFGYRFRVTPQMGYRFTTLKGTWCSSVTIGVRAYCALSSHFGISLTPEYAVGISKSKDFKKLSALSSKIKGFGEGFNGNLSIVLTF